MTSVETLRSRADFAAARGSHEFAAEMRRVAGQGELAASAWLAELRREGKKIVEAAITTEESRNAE